MYVITCLAHNIDTDLMYRIRMLLVQMCVPSIWTVWKSWWLSFRTVSDAVKTLAGWISQKCRCAF